MSSSYESALTEVDGHMGKEDIPHGSQHDQDGLVDLEQGTYDALRNTRGVGKCKSQPKQADISCHTYVLTNIQHQCDQLKVWKGRAFHDFYNWMYILGDKPDFSAYKAFDFLFASNFFKQIQPNRVEWNKLANEQAPLVFGLGTTNRVAKSMWAAINQLQRETTHQYMVLLYKDMNFNQHTGEIYGPPSAWALVKKSFEDGIVDFDGTKFRKKANPLFRNGLYYFEDDIADHVEKIMHAGQFKSREKLLQNPGCSKKWAAMKRKMERMEQDTRYLKIRTAYTTKKSNKLTGNTVNFSTMERSMARGALLDNSPPTVNTHCHLCSCADCPCVNCEFKLQRIINIKSREERKYAGLPVTRHQLYLFDECTQWSVLQSIVQNDFGLLQKRYEKPCFRALDEVNFQKWCGDAYLKLVSGVRKAEKDPDGRVSVPRLHDVLCRPAGPFDEGTDHYNGNADLGLNIYLTYAHNDDIIDEDESFSLTLSRCLKSLRKMVAHAGEAGKADLLVYFDILDIKVKDFADPHAKIMAFLHEISAFDDMSTKDWERYNLKSRVLIFESKWDVGCGFVLKAQDMVHESMVAYIRKYVIERGMDLTVRQGTLKRIQDAGIEVEDILSSGDMDSAEYNEGFRAWLFAEGSESARVEKRRYNLFIDVYSSARREAREKEKVAEAYGIKNRLDLGFGIRLCLKALDRMGATKRTGWRKVVEDNGPSKEGRKKSMEQLRQAMVKVVDLLRDTTECSYGDLGYDYPSDYPSGVAYKDGVLMPRVE